MEGVRLTTSARRRAPYNVGANKQNGEIWITGSNSDTLIRFRPESEDFTVFPLPTRSDFTREIEFDDDGGVWTCTSDQPIAPDVPGTGRIIHVGVRERVGPSATTFSTRRDCYDCDAEIATCAARHGGTGLVTASAGGARSATTAAMRIARMLGGFAL